MEHALSLLQQPSSTSSLPIDSLRLKLVQTIDQLTSLQSSLHYHSISTPEPSTQNPGIIPFPELLIQFNLLLSHIVGLGGILSDGGLDSVGGLGGGGGSSGGGGDKKVVKDKKKEKWDNVVVVPRVNVEESRDWIVGMLLRTKQTPAVESHLHSLLSSLPPSLSTSNSSSTIHHQNLINHANLKISELKESIRGEEWDWKLRVDVEDDPTSDTEEAGAGAGKGGEGEEMQTGEDGEKEGGKKTANLGRKWTLAQIVEFQKSGKMP